jgi:hypothetical protein
MRTRLPLLAAALGAAMMLSTPAGAASLGPMPAKQSLKGTAELVHWRPYRHCHGRHHRRYCHGGRRHFRGGYGWGGPGIYLRFGNRGHRHHGRHHHRGHHRGHHRR